MRNVQKHQLVHQHRPKCGDTTCGVMMMGHSTLAILPKAKDCVSYQATSREGERTGTLRHVSSISGRSWYATQCAQYEQTCCRIAQHTVVQCH